MQPEHEFIFGRSDLQARRDLRRTRCMYALLLAAFLAVPITAIAYGNRYAWLLLPFAVLLALFGALAISKRDPGKWPDRLWRIIIFPAHPVFGVMEPQERHDSSSSLG